MNRLHILLRIERLRVSEVKVQYSNISRVEADVQLRQARFGGDGVSGLAVRQPICDC